MAMAIMKNYYIGWIAFLSLNLNGMNHAAYQSLSSIPWGEIPWGKIAGTVLITGWAIHPLTDFEIKLRNLPIVSDDLTEYNNYRKKTIKIDSSEHLYKKNGIFTHNIFKPIGTYRLLTVSQMAWNELKKGNFPGAIIRILIMGIPFCDTSTLFTIEGNLKFPWQPNPIQ